MKSQVKILHEIYTIGNKLNKEFIAKKWNVLEDTNILVENLRKTCPSIDVPEIDKEIDPEEMKWRLIKYYTFYPIVNPIIQTFFKNNELERLEREYNIISNMILDTYEKKYDNPLFSALTDIIENIEYQSIRQKNRQEYFLESCHAHGFSDEDTSMLWEMFRESKLEKFSYNGFN